MPVTIRSFIQSLTYQFRQAGLTEPRHESVLLTAEILRLTRLQLYQMFDQVITEDQLKTLYMAADERCKGVPLAYITGNVFFFDLSFHVRRNVLIPRADSEILVEQGLSFLRTKHPHTVDRTGTTIRILDLCTGTGCIGISLAVNLRRKGINPELILTDISPDAAACARDNVQLHQLQACTKVLETDLFPDSSMFFDLITANPPYIPAADIQSLMPEVKANEPHLALDGGQDGLDFYKRILNSVDNFLRPGGLLLLEHGFDQGAAVQQLLIENPSLTGITLWQDYAGQDRVSGGFRKNQA